MSEKTCHIRTHAVIMNSEVYRNVILTYSPDNPNRLPIISDFSTETHSTTSYNGIIIIAPAGYQLPPEFSISGTINGPEQFTEDRLDIPPSIKVQFFIRHSVIIHDEQIRLFQ